jgi:predicted MFS family arabinose efflux permease
MQRFLTRYGAFFRLPDVTGLLVMAFVARMPVGMTSLAVLMHLRELSGSFAFAGGMVGTALIAMACAAPVVGRIVDRHGPRGVLIVTGIVQPLALMLLLLAQPLGLPLAAIPPIAAAIGAFQPPISVLTRTMWRHRLEREEDRRTAFAIDVVLIEINFTLGPALIALVLLFASPAVALGLTTLFALCAAPTFLVSAAPRYWKLSRGEERHLLGPLTEPRLLLVYATTSSLTFMFGMIEVGYPGYATALGRPALAGALIAFVSIGSALGGFAYGGAHLALPVERQLSRFLLAMVIPLGAQVWATSPWVFLPLAFVSGLLIAPSLTALTLLVTRNAPSRYATEAFTWMSTCVVSGIGAGTAVGGQLVEAAGASATFAAAAAACLVATLMSLTLRSRP